MEQASADHLNAGNTDPASDASACVALSASLNDQRRFEEAIAACRQALRLDPQSCDACNNLGIALAQLGRLEEATASFQQALRLNPDYPLACNNLGAAYLKQGRLEEALACFSRALELQPGKIEPYNNLATLLRKTGRLAEALACLEEATRLNPECAGTYANLAALYTDQGRLAQAVECYRRALALEPNSALAHSAFLLCLNYDSNADPAAVFAEHRRWAERFAAPLAAHVRPHPNDRAPDRPLRVGYVSSDFRAHPVASFLQPILEAHDRRLFEITCYANLARADAVTGRFRALGHRWRDVFGMTDAELADAVREDGIDILIDTAGHTRDNRLLLFARKPAPVQVTYLGYPNTTGLTAIDYRLTDAWADPPGRTDHLHSEELVRLPHGFLCYRPPEDCPDVGPLPVLTRRHVTFSSFNYLPKMTPETVASWSEVLRRVPGSRLVLKYTSLSDEATRELVRARFRDHGIGPDRLELVGAVASAREHLALYGEIDIALDPFPYNGTTTTCEALWMGVPVIALAGRTHAGRVGVSLLDRIGLRQLIARSPESYVELAVRLANDLGRLRELRAGLREKMARSPLMDAGLFTRSLEQACRWMWRRWVGRAASAP